MIITATPQPENFPPRIRLDIDSEGDEFLGLTVLRDGRPIRQQPAVMGLSETFVYDYEAPFGVPVTYTAQGVIPGGPWEVVHNETWASLSGWTTESGSPAVSAGRVSGGVISRALEGVGGKTVRLVIPSRAAVSNSRITLGEVGFSALTRSVTGGTAYSIAGATPYTALAIGATGAILVTLSVDRQNVSVTHGGTTVDRTVAGGGNTLRVSPQVLGFGDKSVGAFSVEASTGLAVSASTSATLDVPEAWLIHPIQPSLSIPIERFSRGGEMSVAASTDETRTYASRQAIYQPNGRREAVSYPLGPRGAGSWTLVLMLENIEARNDLMTLLDDQAPVLLRSPGEADWDLPDGWYSVGDVDVSRPIDIGGVELRRATLPLTKVAEPPVKIAPQLTWGDLMLRGVKWGDLLNKTWLQALMGEV